MKGPLASSFKNQFALRNFSSPAKVCINFSNRFLFVEDYQYYISSMLRNYFKHSTLLTQLFQVPVTVAYGDGIGPEITKASLFVLNEAGAQIDPQNITIGEKLYLSGHTSGIASESWDSIRYFLSIR